MKCNVQAKALIQLLLKDSAPDTHTHTQIPRMRNGPSRLVRFGRDERTRMRPATSRSDQTSPASATRREQKKCQRDQRQRRDAIGPASRCDQSSASEMRPAQSQRDATSPAPVRYAFRARADQTLMFVLPFLVLLGHGPLMRGLLSLSGPRVTAPPSCKGPPLQQEVE